MKYKVERTERGWAGHHDASDKCKFRRNTLVQDYKYNGVVVSTIRALYNTAAIANYDQLGIGYYYETKAFKAWWNGEFWQANTNVIVCHETSSKFHMPDSDFAVNIVHENAVNKIIEILQNEDEIVTIPPSMPNRSAVHANTSEGIQYLSRYEGDLTFLPDKTPDLLTTNRFNVALMIAKEKAKECQEEVVHGFEVYKVGVLELID